MRFPLAVRYCRFRGQRRIIRTATHSLDGGVEAASEKEARLALIDDYNRHGLKILSIAPAEPKEQP